VKKSILITYALFLIPCLHAADTAAIDAAVAKGMRFLLAQQQADGHFSDSNTPALTALPLWAMSALGEVRDNAAAKKAANFVLKCQQPDGGFYAKMPPRGQRPSNGTGGPGGLSTYNTSVCLTALYESGLAPTAPLLKARTFLAESQLDGEDTLAGGFGYGPSNGCRRYADLSNTAYAMDAMRRTEKLEEFRVSGDKKADINWDLALSFVDNLQQKDGERKGGAAYNERTPQAGSETNRLGRVKLMAYGSMSYAAVMSMMHAKLSKGDPRVRNALGYCERFWTLDENPGMGSQGLYYYYDILARALSVAAVDKIGGHEWKRELAVKLLSLQKPDGSWSNENNRFWEGDPVLVTSFSVLCLQLCR